MNNIEIRSSCCHAQVRTKYVSNDTDGIDITTCTNCGRECTTVEWDPETEAVKRVESAEEHEYHD